VLYYYEKFIQLVAFDVLNVLFSKRICNQALLICQFDNKSTLLIFANTVIFKIIKTQGQVSWVANGYVKIQSTLAHIINVDTKTEYYDSQHVLRLVQMTSTLLIIIYA